MGTARITEGPARQLWPATLASPPFHEAYAHGLLIIVYFHDGTYIFFCVSAQHDCCRCCTWGRSPEGKSLAGSHKGYKLSRLMTCPLGGFCVLCKIGLPHAQHGSFLRDAGVERSPNVALPRSDSPKFFFEPVALFLPRESLCRIPALV